MTDKNRAARFFSKKRIVIVLLLCAGLTAFLFYSEISKSGLDWSSFHFSARTFFYLALAGLMMFFRDFAYMVRLRILTDKLLSWRQSIRVILLWEFASAVSPGVVGGSAVAMFILQREKIPFGKSTALVIITAIMDNFFYILLLPLLFLLIPLSALFPPDFQLAQSGGWFIFWMGFIIISVINGLLIVSVFLYPGLIGALFKVLFRLPFLRRKKHLAEKIDNDIKTASHELKGKKLAFWFNLFITTVWSWTARYLVINFVLLAFIEIGFLDNFIILGRQLVMWTVMLITPTPGGSGMAEYLFGELLSDFIANGTLALSLAFLWRLISYYPYLVIGSFILPKWLGETGKLDDAN